MIDMHRELTTTASPETVFTYLSDFTSTEEWDPGTVRTVRTSGDGGVGTRYTNTSRFAGRTSDLVYEVVALDPGTRVHFRGINASLIADDTITVSPRPDGGCAVKYRVRFAFQGWLRWVEPVLRIAVTRLLDDGARSMSDQLARL